MEKVDINISVKRYDDESELSKKDQKLLASARESTKRAYAPYSKFKVGAAVLLKNGTIIQGNNQENAAYPSGICAERVALFYASSLFPDMEVDSMAITAQSDEFDIKTPVAPCGSCRQVMSEYESKQSKNIRVILQGETGAIYEVHSTRDLLPLAFTQDDLHIDK